MDDLRLSESDLLEKLLDALQDLPDIHAQPPVIEPARSGPEGARPDFEIHLDVAGKPLTLIIEAKKSVYPRDVRQILWQVRQFGAFERIAGHDMLVPLLASESISPGAKELLRKERVGYFDTGGSLYVPAQGAYIFIDKPPPKTLEKSVRSLFKGKRAQVLHALLIKHEEWFGVKELAELAHVSSGTASESLSALERFDWLESRGQGPSKERFLANPGALLDEWTRQPAGNRQRSERRYYVPSLDTDALMEKLAHLCSAHGAEYAFTREAAAQIYAPFLSSLSRVACRMAPGDAMDTVLGELNARIVSEGTNLVVIETPSQGEFLFRERIRGIVLVSPVQVYLDLMQGKGRANEMAQHLRQERIGF